MALRCSTGRLFRLLTACAFLGLALGGTVQRLDAQSGDGHDFNMPDDLLKFWDAYSEAKEKSDTDEMEAAVRGDLDAAEQCLDLLIDDVSKREIEALHHELRELAWTLDDVTRSERYISRVRLVLELEVADRAARAKAIQNWWDAVDLEQVAREAATIEAWTAVILAYTDVQDEFLEVGDYESAFKCASRLEQIEQTRNRPWERSRYLASVVALGEKLEFREPLIQEARVALESLAGQGIDPLKEKPKDLEKADADIGTIGGRGLDSFDNDSEELSFPLKLKVAKKGITGVSLPTIYPPEQYQLWPRTYIAGDGPADFDMQRSTYLDPFGARWALSRSAIAEFGLDVNRDGEVDVIFSPSSTPSKIEVPAPDGGEPFSLMVATMSDRENMFGIEANYAPVQSGARLRFWIASWREAKVLGSTWKFYDLNISGKYGDFVQNWDDLCTIYDDDDSISFWEPDGVLVGKGKKAIPLSTVLPVRDDFYRVWMDSSGENIKLRKLNLMLGKLKLDMDYGVAPSHLLVREVGGKLDGAYFDVLPSRRGGVVTLPAGEYQVVQGSLRTGKRTSMDMVRIYTGKSEPFKVNAGATTTLELGAPYSMTFTTRKEGKETVVETQSLRIFGRGGEEYAMFFDDPLQPSVEMRDSSGRKVGKAQTMRRTGIEEWQTKNNERDNVLWFPAEHRVEVPNGATYEFRLTQKEHSLLGGPLQSDWIK
jgi:hypothetical protein